MKSMKIQFGEKVAYGFGDFASSMFWKLFSAYLLYFYTDVVGIAAAAVGTMFLVTRIWDTAFDPLVGVIADRVHTRWGKFRPFILWFAIPFGAIGVLTFFAPEMGYQEKITYAYITYTLMMMIYSLINVPYASLMGVMSTDSKERTTLSTYRFVFAFAGSILVLGTAEPLVAWFGRAADGAVSESRGWFYTVACFALLAVLMFFVTFLKTRERIKPPQKKNNKLKTDFIDLLQNKQWFILLGAGVATLIFNSIRDGSAIFYFKYFVVHSADVKLPLLEVSLQYSSLYLVIGQAANIIGVLLAKPLSDRIGKRNTFAIAMLLAALFSMIFYMLGREQILLMFILQCVISICAGCIFPLLWAMYADIADYSEWKTGRRATGLIFSSSSMSQKLGWSIGGALTGWILSAYGFEANSIQHDYAENGLKMMMSIFPAIGAFVSFGIILFYQLSDHKMHNINQDLQGKREIK
ncbi:MFS transporter [Sphingobacterium sp. SGG-5]|uniref:MFS transporter n=1 Tax=Sphingobacterium sp. SGG-5 TaxID=2710881 RepID=UPI0013EDB963|nr:MFS transporter [Sphingobacterium sp. SGG-5]NGM62567.1 MFS transporter [Sphingobacterium sp. SGG-5]